MSNPLSNAHHINCAAISLCVKPGALSAFMPFIESFSANNGDPDNIQVRYGLLASNKLPLNANLDDPEKAKLTDEVEYYRENTQLLGKRIEVLLDVIRTYQQAGDTLADWCPDRGALNGWHLADAKWKAASNVP